MDGFYIRTTMKVFINPVVAALPEHAHLFPQFGCYGGRDKGARINRECLEEKNETPLSKHMYPLNLTAAMDDKWNTWVIDHVQGWKRK